VNASCLLKQLTSLDGQVFIGYSSYSKWPLFSRTQAAVESRTIDVAV